MAFLPIIEHQQHARIHAHAAPFHALRHLQYRFTCKTLGTNRNTYVSVLGDEGLAGIKVPVEDNKQQGRCAVCCVCGAHGPWARFRSSLSPTVRFWFAFFTRPIRQIIQFTQTLSLFFI